MIDNIARNRIERKGKTHKADTGYLRFKVQ